MNQWLEWGIPIIECLQNLGALFQTPMEFFSFLGTEYFYLIIMPALLWCFDAGLGIRVGLILMASANINGTLKLVFGLPRPYWVSTKVHALAAESSFGFPSGHSQNAASLWGRLAMGLKRRWLRWGCLAVILLISLSRLFLAVHFPLDVLGGWLIGCLLVWVSLDADEPVRRFFSGRPAWQGILILLAVSVALIVAGLSAASFAEMNGLPQAWIDAAAAAAPDADPINPFDINGIISSAAVLFGLGSGAVLLAKGKGFNSKGEWMHRAARYGVGLVGLIILYFGLRLILPQGETILAQWMRFLRYALVGFWVTYLAPMVFRALKIG